jgi:tryptophan synthase beta chain
VARLEGIIPALESSHAVAWALAAPASPSGSSPASPRSELDLICLSGRGDKDLAEALSALER